MQKHKTYQIGKIKQLIDLNGDTVNFDINFKVSSKNNLPFEMLVVDQTTLDNNPNLDYKKVVNGSISGDIHQDKNVYQNYFLILKADQPCECEVEINKKELPKNNNLSSTKIQENLVINKENKQIKNNLNWEKIILIIVVIGVFFIILYFYYKNSNMKEKEPFKIDNKLFATSPPPPSHLSPREISKLTPDYRLPKISKTPSSSSSLSSSENESILDRLKKLNVN